MQPTSGSSTFSASMGRDHTDGYSGSTTSTATQERSWPSDEHIVRAPHRGPEGYGRARGRWLWLDDTEQEWYAGATGTQARNPAN